MKPIMSLADLKARTYDTVYGYELWATRRVLTILVPEDDQ